jgi:hypothetical protein
LLNRRYCPAFDAVDLVDAVALADRPTLAPARQVEVLREHVAPVAFLIPIAITRTAASTEVAVPGIVTIALAVPGIVPVPHVWILPISCRPHFSASARERSTLASMDRRVMPLQAIVGSRQLS